MLYNIMLNYGHVPCHNIVCVYHCMLDHSISYHVIVCHIILYCIVVVLQHAAALLYHTIVRAGHAGPRYTLYYMLYNII